MLCLVECKICHPYGECDAIQTVFDEVNRVRVMTPIRVCDVTGVVHMSRYILHVVSYIEAVMS